MVFKLANFLRDRRSFRQFRSQYRPGERKAASKLDRKTRAKLDLFARVKFNYRITRDHVCFRLPRLTNSTQNFRMKRNIGGEEFVAEVNQIVVRLKLYRK